ncbi:hypothetical protein D3C83_245260 [compost metagenome]
MPVFRDGPAPSSSVSEGELIGEMKSGRKTVFIAIAVALLVVIAIIVVFAT